LRVVAARFNEPRRAAAVLDLLHERLHVALPDADVAPLGTPGQPPSNDAVLAGRFPDEQASLVMDLLRRAGGVVVANVDERWTRPSASDERSRGTNGSCLGNRSLGSRVRAS
jgi:hypothetical protein